MLASINHDVMIGQYSQCIGVAIIICGARHSDHAHLASTCHSTLKQAAKCVKEVWLPCPKLISEMVRRPGYF